MLVETKLMLFNINFVSINEITFSNILDYKQNINISKKDNVFYILTHVHAYMYTHTYI